VWLSFTIRLEAQREQAVKDRDRAEVQAQIARRQTEEARRQSERAAHLLGLNAAAVDDIAISARGAPGDQAHNASAGSVLFQLAAFYSRASAILTTDGVLPQEDRQRLAEQYAASAVRLLNCAERAGWFAPPRQANREALDKDPTFRILHKREDYKKFRVRLP
jgi:hypothetical protein